MKKTPDSASLRSDAQATDSTWSGCNAKTAATKPLCHGARVIRTNAANRSRLPSTCNARFVAWYPRGSRPWSW